MGRGARVMHALGKLVLGGACKKGRQAAHQAGARVQHSLVGGSVCLVLGAVGTCGLLPSSAAHRCCHRGVHPLPAQRLQSIVQLSRLHLCVQPPVCSLQSR